MVIFNRKCLILDYAKPGESLPMAKRLTFDWVLPDAVFNDKKQDSGLNQIYLPNLLYLRIIFYS